MLVLNHIWYIPINLVLIKWSGMTQLLTSPRIVYAQSNDDLRVSPDPVVLTDEQGL